MGFDTSILHLSVVTKTGDTTYDNDDLDDAIFVHSFGFSLVCSFFRSFARFSKNRSCRCDDFRAKIINIEAILAIFRPLNKKSSFFS